MGRIVPLLFLSRLHTAAAVIRESPGTIGPSPLVSHRNCLRIILLPFTPGFGYAGAAISVFAFEFTPLVWNAFMVQKRCKGAFPIGNICMGLLFLSVITFLYAPFHALLLQIGLHSKIIRSLGGTLFFIVCIILYMFFRFRNKTGDR